MSLQPMPLQPMSWRPTSWRWPKLGKQPRAAFAATLSIASLALAMTAALSNRAPKSTKTT